MKKTTYALALCGVITTAVMLSACKESRSSSSGQTPVGPVAALKADGSCDLTTLNSYLAAADSCNLIDPFNIVLGVLSCTGAGLVSYAPAGGGAVVTSGWRGFTFSHETQFRCTNHLPHPAL